ncbi:hypothetical protein LSG23_20460 (plasmid) [Bacillus velezensis]|uniref:hypothetical protein n=1 Tax=Bacillus velezensis TaxID=492670 RepID=UPI0012AB58DF|nr:hypothetical protein [Bacillus velezensis]WNR83219.1 hypothetical protein RP314_20380 [Bacillus velezensis]
MRHIEKNVMDAIHQLNEEVEILKKYNAGVDTLEIILIKANMLYSIVTNGADEEHAPWDYFKAKDVLEKILE